MFFSILYLEVLFLPYEDINLLQRKHQSQECFCSTLSWFAWPAVFFLTKTPGLCIIDRRTSAIFRQLLWLSQFCNLEVNYFARCLSISFILCDLGHKLHKNHGTIFSLHPKALYILLHFWGWWFVSFFKEGSLPHFSFITFKGRQVFLCVSCIESIWVISYLQTSNLPSVAFNNAVYLKQFWLNGCQDLVFLIVPFSLHIYPFLYSVVTYINILFWFPVLYNR